MRLFVAALALAGAHLLALPASHAETIECNRFGCHSGQLIKIRNHNAPNGATVLGRRPRGCPHRYCGCGLSLKLFGKIIPRLNLAANWPRTFQREHHPRSGLVAARRHHVMLLLRHVDRDRWLVFDPNSGGGLTREHIRSVRGFVFVDPNSGGLS